MNRHEKDILNMTLQDIAAEATQRINEELNKPNVHLWRSRQIIANIVDTYIPKTTFKNMGISVYTECIGGSHRGVPQTVCLKITMRKSHPFYHVGRKRSGYTTTAALFDISRKREAGELRFRSLGVWEKKRKNQTLVELCDQNTQHLIYLQKSVHNAAQTLLAVHDILGQERMKEILAAAKHLELQHDNCFLDDRKGGYRSMDWSSKEDLIMASGLRSRTQRILKGVKEGTHVKPAGIVLEHDYAPYKNNPLNHLVTQFELGLDESPEEKTVSTQEEGNATQLSVRDLDYGELLQLKEALCYGADRLPEMTAEQRKMCEEADCADDIPDELVFALYENSFFSKDYFVVNQDRAEEV